jgi:hypothetical protein
VTGTLKFDGAAMSSRNASVFVLTVVLGAAVCIMNAASRPARAEAAPAKATAKGAANQTASEQSIKRHEFRHSTEIFTYTTTAKYQGGLLLRLGAPSTQSPVSRTLTDVLLCGPEMMQAPENSQEDI